MCDIFKFSKFQPIAKALGLDTSSHNNLWRDRVAVEVNTAVLHSFKIAGVSIVDQVIYDIKLII